VKNPVWARVWARGDRGDFRNEAIFIVKHYVEAYFDVTMHGPHWVLDYNLKSG